MWVSKQRMACMCEPCESCLGLAGVEPTARISISTEGVFFCGFKCGNLRFFLLPSRPAYEGGAVLVCMYVTSTGYTNLGGYRIDIGHPSEQCSRVEPGLYLPGVTCCVRDTAASGASEKQFHRAIFSSNYSVWISLLCSCVEIVYGSS